MITFCLNEHPSSRGFDPMHRPQLAFICKAEGKEAAIPRVMHKHDDRFEIMFIRSGSGVYNIDGRDYNVKQGDVILFNANVLHDENPTGTEDLLIFSCGVKKLKVDGLPVNVLTTRTQAAVMHCGGYYEEICQLFDLMWTHINARQLYHSDIADNLLYVLLLLCRRMWIENEAESENNKILLGQRIKDFIDDHYKDDMALTSITAALNMSYFYLSHVFKAYSGYSPKQYQTRRRIGEAQTILLSTDLAITEVANAVGYDNVNNFHRIFHNIIGIPPARYKKFWLNGQIRK